jgi:hypothetical protein
MEVLAARYTEEDGEGEIVLLKLPSIGKIGCRRRAVALMELAAVSVVPCAEKMEREEGVLVLIGADQGISLDLAPPATAMPPSPAELWTLSVDARRRGALLVVKQNEAFRIVTLLEIWESVALWLLEQA